MEVTIDPRFNGPPRSANGGYTCGLVASLAGGGVEVTLRSPPPLGTPLRWDGERLWDGDALVAEAAPAGSLDLDVPDAVGWDEAAAATPHYAGFAQHAFPTCFVCGPERAPGDGLRIFASPVRGDLVAATWEPPEHVGPQLVWAALDCPGAFAVGFSARGETVLGRMAAEIRRAPEPGERCVVVAWPRGEDGRKLYAGSALYAGEELLAAARQTWIAPR
ncbi:MAG TPA: hypothetical protein VM290_07280 [Gaiellaceae bacterium]|nr:hypothetical protein [Gaiellaceae bacterium]